MSLLDIRKKFVESSGRYDLVVDTDTWADNGADWFIQAAQKYLDCKLEVGHDHARYFGLLPYSQNSITIPKARVIKEVFRVYPDGRHPIWNKAWELSTSAEVVLGVPAYFMPLTLRSVIGSDFSKIPGNVANIAYQEAAYTGLWFDKAADMDYGLEVIGLFYSPELTADESKSFWTEGHPEILVAASFMCLERFYRNFEGLKESKASVDELCMQLDFDAVAQEIVNIVRLEG